MQHIKRLLLIDDDDITNFLHKDLIDKTGIANEVIALKGAEKALAYIAQGSQEAQPANQQKEVILLDINMPNIDGFDFLEALKDLRLADRFKVFIVSSSQNTKDTQKAKEYEVCGYVCKPLTEEKVLAIAKKAQQNKLAGCPYEQLL